MNTEETQQALALAIAAARAGGRELTRRFGTALTHATKGHLDFATEADVDSERAILAVLREGGPWPVTGEESGNSGPEAGDGRRWYVDPLCGTVNFAHGIRLFCANVGLAEGLDPLLGASFDPTAQETFMGAVGSGGWLETADAGRVALRPTVKSGLVDIDFRHAEPGQPSYLTYRMPLLTAFSDRFAPIRLNTSLSLAYVAAGRLAGYVHDGTGMEVHFAAGVAVARSAGAAVFDLAGNPWRMGASGLIAAATEDLARDLLDIWRSIDNS